MSFDYLNQMKIILA